ncbi:MAG TPA: uroporphyrinogen decarboxylase family protein [Bacillota bacterium]|jgi:uroporphyrinogen decarboxylase|nr:uroporphyrinogen-III decarboxylase-like protein [Bacillota bacterium]HOB42345.1 uroporphyrinogen decarboxylase family protein [Bacillota bacterium]HOO29874.1 uroporphyrinogen decarboxylase family protein [Bacillota bacterium]HPZ13990.1 uroporphyrinogen decarboxylase family protein [Bacillota bacterium]HQD80738.1 uroporphyrinogen decarboxylase family protein [Bacillota bacterium]
MTHQFAVPFSDPKPDFEGFRQVLEGKRDANRVHYAELFADREIVEAILADYMGLTPVPSPEDDFEEYWRQQIEYWYKMGYDYIRVAGGLEIPRAKHRIAEDTAALSRGERGWIEQGIGEIASWADFEEYPWQTVEDMDFSAYEFVAKNLPEGMKMLVCPSSGVFEISSEYMLGFEGMSMMLYEDPELVEAVFLRVGQMLFDFYRNAVTIDNVAGIFQGDDLGFKTSTFLSPTHLRKLVFPWHKRYAELAHERGQVYWLHSCGNLQNVIDDLIDDVGIDAIHSFQDEIMPVADFKDEYGHRVGVLGGIDIDKLCRLDEADLRSYVRTTIDRCMPRGWALGSGNSIANYVPVRSFLIMMDEGAKWRG